MYTKIIKLFDMGYPTYIGRHGKLKSNHIYEFLLEMQWACKLVPGLEHIEKDEYGCANLTDEQIEMMYNYFHENPDVYIKYLHSL